MRDAAGLSEGLLMREQIKSNTAGPNGCHHVDRGKHKKQNIYAFWIHAFPPYQTKHICI